MRTLTGGSAYFNQSIQPRVFVRVFDGSTDILVQGTEANGTYPDRIASFDNITSEIDPAGGMSTVSGGGVKRLTLDEDFTLCTTASLEPEPQSAYAGAGRLICTGSSGGAYADTRNATACTDFGTPAISVGRIYNAGGDWFTVVRAFVQFKVPAGMTSCEDAYIALVGSENGASTAFTIQGVAGTWSNLSSTTGLFNDFTGWAASGTYSVTNLLETWTTAEYDATATYLRFNAAGRAAILAATGSTFRMILISSLDTTINAGPSGNEYVTFESSSARLALRYNSVTLDNKDVEILLGFDPVTTINSTALDVVTTQIVDTWRLDGRELDMTFRANDFKENPTIPGKIISATDWTDCPEENIGKPYPVMYGGMYSAAYGSHAAGIGRDTSPGASGLRDYVPSPVVRHAGASAYETPGRILVAGADIKNSLRGFPAVWDSARKKFARLWSNVGSDVTASDNSVYVEYVPRSRTYTDLTDITASAAPPVKEDFIGIAYSIIPSNVVRYDGATNPEYGYIGDGVNYATLTGANAYMDYAFKEDDSFSGRERVEVLFDMTVSGTAPIEVGLYEADTEINTASGTALEGTDGVFSTVGGVTSFDSATGTFVTSSVAAGDILVITSGATAGEWPILAAASETRLTMLYNATAGTGLSWKVINAGAKLEWSPVSLTGQKIIVFDSFNDEPRKYRLRFTITSGAGSVQISNVQVRVFMKAELKNETIYLDKNGYAFASWIDAAGRSNSSNSGDLIENPAHVIEALARNEMSLATADIDTAAFDTAASAVSGCKFAFQLNDRKDARDILDGLGRQARTFLRWNESDQLTIKKISSADYFSNSGTDVPGAHDIFTTTGTPTAGVFANHQLLSDVRIELSDADDHYTTFVLKYRQNYATGDYAAVLTCDKDAENLDDTKLFGTTGTALKALCSAAYTRSGKINTLEMECPYIRDETTATLLMQHLIEWYSVRRYTLEFTAGISALCFVEGDFINVRTDTIENLFGTAVMNRKKWLVKRRSVSLNDMTITFTAIEV